MYNDRQIKELLFKRQHDFSRGMLNKINHTVVKLTENKKVYVDNVMLIPEQYNVTDFLMKLGNSMFTYVDEFGMVPGIVKGICRIYKRCEEVVAISINGTFYVNECLLKTTK